MKMATIHEFRARMADWLRRQEPVLITRHGKPAALLVPLDDTQELSVELRKDLLRNIGGRLARQLEEKGITEKEVLDGFESAKKSRRR